MIALHVDKLSKSFGNNKAVDRLSFSVSEGEIFGFLGGNGAGKTTSLRMILDIIRPDSGTISVLGHPPGREQAGGIGFIPEERGLYRTMSPLETVVFFGRMKGMSRAAALTRGRALLSRFDIDTARRTTMAALSKGMAQKVQIVTALINSPRLLILDEPFSGLDPINQSLLEREILHTAREDGAAVLFSTHVMQHAERLSDRFLIMAEGHKLFEGNRAQAFARMGNAVRLTCEADPSRLPGVARVRAVGEGGEGWQDWQVTLEPDASAEALLETCTRTGFVLRRFELPNPSLHEAFIAIVGQSRHLLNGVAL